MHAPLVPRARHAGGHACASTHLIRLLAVHGNEQPLEDRGEGDVAEEANHHAERRHELLVGEVAGLEHLRTQRDDAQHSHRHQRCSDEERIPRQRERDEPRGNVDDVPKLDHAVRRLRPAERRLHEHPPHLHVVDHERERLEGEGRGLGAVVRNVREPK